MNEYLVFADKDKTVIVEADWTELNKEGRITFFKAATDDGIPDLVAAFNSFISFHIENTGSLGK